MTTLSGCLERRVWAQLSGGKLYPNLYTMLVASPGVGKDQAINPAVNMMRAAGCFHVSPISVTGKGLLDALASSKAVKDFKFGTDLVKYHTMFVAVPEFGTLLDKHDLGFLSILNELYNCSPMFEEKLRSRKEDLVIENPHMAMLTGTQPSYMASMFPEEAWGMGFFARTMLIYQGKAEKKAMFSGGMFKDSTEREHREKELVNHLKRVQKLTGPMSFTEGAQSVIEHFNEVEAEAEAPQHPRLFHYNTRRTLHLIKISMVLAGAELKMEITEDHVNQAKSAMYEAEGLMPEIFKEMAHGGHKSHLDDAFYYICRMYNASGRKPVPEHKIIQMLSAKVPAQLIPHLLNTMLNSKMIKEASESDDPKIKLLAQFNKLTQTSRSFEPVLLSVVE